MFKKWCKEQGFFNGSNLSHVLMDGGVLSVPFDRLNTFYEKYVEAYNSGEKIFVVEQKTENYNFFVDLDYKDEDEMTFSEVESICKVICDKVKKFGGKEALISVAAPKPAGHLILMEEWGMPHSSCALRICSAANDISAGFGPIPKATLVVLAIFWRVSGFF